MNETATMCVLHNTKEDELKYLKRGVCSNLANDLVTKHNVGDGNYFDALLASAEARLII